MDIKHVYWAVMLAVMGAWFSQGTSKPSPAPQAHASDGRQEVMARMVTDPASVGLKPGKWRAAGKCNIEFINGSLMGGRPYAIGRDKPLKLIGWALDDERARLPKELIVRFTSASDAKFYTLAQTGLMRSDVKDYFKLVDRLTASGFSLALKTPDIPPGEYALTLLMPFEDTTYICDNGRKILVK